MPKTPQQLEREYENRKRQGAAVEDLVGLLPKFKTSYRAQRDAPRLGPTPAELTAEREQLRAMMGDLNSSYWRGPEAEANQERYRALIADTDTETE